MNSYIILFAIASLLWASIGFGLGLLWARRGAGRLVAFEEAVRARRRDCGDLVVSVVPSWRLFVRDRGGVPRTVHLEDNGSAIAALVERALQMLAIAWRPPARPHPSRPPPTPQVPSGRTITTEGETRTVQLP